MEAKARVPGTTIALVLELNPSAWGTLAGLALQISLVKLRSDGDA